MYSLHPDPLCQAGATGYLQSHPERSKRRVGSGQSGRLGVEKNILIKDLLFRLLPKIKPS